MHFALISSICKPTQPDAKGGQEVWAAQFILEEIKRNHTFDLYATKNSLNIPNKIILKEILTKNKDEIKTDPFFTNSLQQQRDLDAFAFYAYAKIMLEIKKNESEYDCVIDSSGNPLISLNWHAFTKPLIIVGHFPVQKQYVKFFQYFSIPPNVYFVFLSQFQSNHASWIPKDKKFLIPNGIDITNLHTNKNPDSRNLVWLGRLDPDMPKGAEEAIMVANKMRLPLSMYSYIEDDARDYYKNTIEPLIQQNHSITITLPPQPTKNEIFKNAKLLLFPAKWDEPFPLVMLETLATGTPIVAFAKGSLPEVIKDGETGFIVNSSDDDIRGDWIIKKTGIEGLCEAVERIYAMPEEEYRQMRRNCRRHVEEHFTVERMVDDYEKVYQQILTTNPN